MKKAVKIIAIVYSVICGIALILCFIALFRGAFWEGLFAIISLIVSLILLWALCGALDKIDILEERIFKIDDRLRELRSKMIKDDNPPYKKCGHCGAMVRTDDLKCPMCNNFYDE